MGERFQPSSIESEQNKPQERFVRRDLESNTNTKLEEQKKFLTESFKDDNEHFELFIEYFSNLPEQERIKLVEIFNLKTTNVREYFMLNGYLINQETSTKFKEKFQIKSDGKEISGNEEYKSYYEKLKLLTGKLDKDILGEFGDVFDILKYSEEPSVIVEKYGRNLQDLSDTRFNRLFTLIRESDKKQGLTGANSAYEQFKSIALQANPGLVARFDRIEKGETALPAPTPTPLQQAQVRATFGTNNIERDGNILKSGNLSVDISKNPPEAFMNSGEYKLGVDLPVANFYPAIARFESVKKSIEPQIKGIDQAIDYLNSLSKPELTPTEKSVIKTQLGDTLYSELQLDGVQNAKEVGKKITEKRTNLITEFKKAQDQYQTDLKDLAKKYFESQKKQKEAIQDRLNFISSIGFDVVPQYITDMILAEINRGEYGLLISEPIDLANGNFGVKNEDPNRIAPNEKQVFIKLFNKMISGEEGQPINPIQHGGEVNVPIDKADLKEQLAKSGVFPNKEKWDINKMRENLKKGKEK